MHHGDFRSVQNSLFVLRLCRQRKVIFLPMWLKLFCWWNSTDETFLRVFHFYSNIGEEKRFKYVCLDQSQDLFTSATFSIPRTTGRAKVASCVIVEQVDTLWILVPRPFCSGHFRQECGFFLFEIHANTVPTTKIPRAREYENGYLQKFTNDSVFFLFVDQETFVYFGRGSSLIVQTILL